MADEDDGDGDGEPVFEEVPCSIKCCLRKVLIETENKERFLRQLRTNCITCTKIARLASLLIHFVFYSVIEMDNNTVNAFFDVEDNNQMKNSPTEQKLKDFFYAVLKNYTRSEEYPMWEYGKDFLKMMEEYFVEPPDNNYLDNTFKHQYQQYHTCLKNNIIIHAKSRIRKFLRLLIDARNPVPRNIPPVEKKKHRKQNNNKVYSMIRFLFDGTTDGFDGDLYRGFEEIAQPNTENPCGLFENMQRDWFRLIPIFIRIQKHHFEKNTYSNFIVLPQTTFQRRHVLYDTNALYALHAQLGIVPMRTKTKKMSRQDFTQKPQKIWPKILDLECVKTLGKGSNGNKKFNFSVMTDGVAVSLVCTKVIKKCTDEQRIKKIQKKFNSGYYKFGIGLDPGYRLSIGGIRRNLDNGAERNIRVKSGKFYRDTREYRRNKAKERIDDVLQGNMAEDRKNYRVTPSNKR